MTGAQTLIVFAGPTLNAEMVQNVYSAEVRPPAALGDVYQAAQTGAKAIGLIDGFFEGTPSVWHKEILWALSQGIAVYGAASMGALRAAELHPFGMRGIGRIFEAYRDGDLEDDDEVAVQHGPAELGYPALSDAMVGIRETLRAAAAMDIIPAQGSERLVAHAKQLPFGERSWASLLAHAEHAVGADEARALADWLPAGRIDPKREDALAMVEAMAAFAAGDGAVSTPEFTLQHTVMWDKAVRAFEATETALNDMDARVLDELRLTPDRYHAVKRRALAVHLANLGTSTHGQPMDRSLLVEAAANFRAERGLYARASLDRWLTENGLSERDLEALIEREARTLLTASQGGDALSKGLVDQLRLDGDYPALLARARAKHESLSSIQPADHRSNPLDLRHWWFGQVLKRPYAGDYATFAGALDCASPSALDDIIAAEYAFQQATGEPDR